MRNPKHDQFFIAFLALLLAGTPGARGDGNIPLASPRPKGLGW